jgi:hypothetical protein
MANDQPTDKVPVGAEVELLEYKLADKVLERVVSRVKFYVLAFFAGLTLLGILSTLPIIGLISDRVAKDVQAGMEKDAEILRRRLADTLANLTLTSAEILKTTDEARAKLKRLERDYASIEAMNARYSAVQREVSRIEGDLNKAVAGMKTKTDSLSKAIAETSAGRPALLEVTSQWAGPEESLSSITVKGTNLGDRPGKFRVQLNVRTAAGTDKGVRSDFIPVDSASIKSWRNDLIEIAASPPLQRQWADTLKDLRHRHPGISGTSYTKGLEWELVTIHGFRLPDRQAASGPPIEPPKAPSGLRFIPQ